MKNFKHEHGFTLIELLIVMLIVGILTTIVLPQLLGETDKAKDAKAQAALRNALTATSTVADKPNDWSGFNGSNALVSELGRQEPTYE